VSKVRCHWWLFRAIGPSSTEVETARNRLIVTRNSYGCLYKLNLLVRTPAVWKLGIPPRAHIIFLWHHLSKNKLLARGNLAKIKGLD
jgi:hypothetical protein